MPNTGNTRFTQTTADLFKKHYDAIDAMKHRFERNHETAKRFGDLYDTLVSEDMTADEALELAVDAFTIEPPYEGYDPDDWDQFTGEYIGG